MQVEFFSGDREVGFTTPTTLASFTIFHMVLRSTTCKKKRKLLLSFPLQGAEPNEERPNEY